MFGSSKPFSGCRERICEQTEGLNWDHMAFFINTYTKWKNALKKESLTLLEDVNAAFSKKWLRAHIA